MLFIHGGSNRSGSGHDQPLSKGGLTKIPIVVGGIIPEEDKLKLLEMGISKVYTPKDFEMNTIMMDIVNLAEPKEIAAE